MKKILVLALLFVTVFSYGQTPVMYGGGVTMVKQDRFQRTLWDTADGMDTSDSYCVYKESTKVGSHIYLIGFNKEGEENMRLQIEEVFYAPQLEMCFVYQNGMEIRLRQKLF